MQALAMGRADAMVERDIRRGAGGRVALPPLARARGSVRVRAVRRGGRTVLADLRQEGSARLLLPRGDGPMLDAALLVTAGGITGGDVVACDGAAGEGAWLGLTTQAAERVYRARPGETGRVTVRLSAAAGARLDWLPQETILFEGSAMARRLEVELAADAVLLAVEPVVFGRAAMGERITRLRFGDQWRIRRDGRLIHAEALRIGGSAGLLARPATLGGAGAMASIVFASERAEAMLDPVRRLLPQEAGASVVRPGVLAVRMLAGDGFELRRRLVPVLRTLRGAPLPSMWMM
jgi:urease accessory protein